MLKTEEYLKSKTGLKDINSRFLFYGSLRKGQYNYNHFIKPVKDTEEEGTHVLEGYAMFSFGSFPAVFKTGDPKDTITVEAFNVPSELTCRSIHYMELGAGYEVEEVELDGKIYWMYIYDPKAASGRERVPNGDWEKYQEERYKKVSSW